MALFELRERSRMRDRFERSAQLVEFTRVSRAWTRDRCGGAAPRMIALLAHAAARTKLAKSRNLSAYPEMLAGRRLSRAIELR